MFRKDTTLSDLHFSLTFVVMWIPMWTNFIATCVLKPKLSPFSESKLFGGEMFVHNSNKIVKSGIFPCKRMEILSECLWEFILTHEEIELFHGGGSFGVSDTIKDRVSYLSVRNLTSDWMSCNHLIFMITPSFSGQERSHGWFVVDSFAFIFNLFQTQVTDVIGKGFIQPKIIPPFHCN